jgi:hypothetical protein
MPGYLQILGIQVQPGGLKERPVKIYITLNKMTKHGLWHVTRRMIYYRNDEAGYESSGIRFPEY